MESCGIYDVQHLMTTYLKGLNQKTREDAGKEIEVFTNLFSIAYDLEANEDSTEFKEVDSNSLATKESMLDALYAVKGAIIKSVHSDNADANAIGPVIDKMVLSVEKAQEKFADQKSWVNLLAQARNNVALSENLSENQR